MVVCPSLWGLGPFTNPIEWLVASRQEKDGLWEMMMDIRWGVLAVAVLCILMGRWAVGDDVGY